MHRPPDHAHTLTHAKGERQREMSTERDVYRERCLQREIKRETEREGKCAAPEHPPPRRDRQGRAREGGRTLRSWILAIITM